MKWSEIGRGRVAYTLRFCNFVVPVMKAPAHGNTEFIHIGQNKNQYFLLLHTVQLWTGSLFSKFRIRGENVHFHALLHYEGGDTPRELLWTSLRIHDQCICYRTVRTPGK